MGYPVVLVCSSVPCPCAGQNLGLALDNHSGGMARLRARSCMERHGARIRCHGLRWAYKQNMEDSRVV